MPDVKQLRSGVSTEKIIERDNQPKRNRQPGVILLPKLMIDQRPNGNLNQDQRERYCPEQRRRGAVPPRGKQRQDLRCNQVFFVSGLDYD